MSKRPPSDTPALDLDEPLAMHIVGIGGAGMSAIAEVLHSMGHRVSGSDLKPSAAVDRLRALGVSVEVGHDAANIARADYLTISTAIPATNPEVVAATAQGIPVLDRATALTAISRQKKTISVAGTHGKTTTSSMLASILLRVDWFPSFIIGGDINEIGSGAVWEDGDWFVVEADESDGTFLKLDTSAAIITSVEPDHLGYYGSEQAMKNAFVAFADAAAGPVVVCLDDEDAAALARGSNFVTYGQHANADYRMADLRTQRAISSFELIVRGESPGRVELAVPGVHNMTNACGAIALAAEIGVPVDDAMAAAGLFTGVARRFEFRGEKDGVTFVDDYAHLPTEVAAALDTAANGGFDRVVCVFQPHRYSRTGDLWATFDTCFDAADVLIVTDIYSSGERPIPGVSGKLIVNAALDAEPWAHVAYLPRHPDLVSYLRANLRDGDLCLTLGAGDLTQLPDEMLEALADR